jgi:hypothetical protein
MLKAANVKIEDAVAIFNAAGATFGLLVPTAIGYGKSIMDATIGFRDFLCEASIHNYANQGQGQEYKVKIPAQFVYPNTCVQTEASLYRPSTKKGDPRIWFSHLTRYCNPTDLLVVVATAGKLSVFNMSNEEIVKSFGIPGSFPYEIMAACANYISETASELLEKITEIHKMGFVKGVTYGDTNVGRTLETLLGISQNSSKAPDYKGIELKSRRGSPKKGSKGVDKITLFTNAPDWSRSNFSAKQIIETFGYEGEHGRQLYCTISNTPNSQGLYLDASDEIDLINKAQTKQYKGDVAVWALSKLKERLNEKHRETFWVYAKSDSVDGSEYFRYDFVKHTRKPNSTNMGSMFDAGILTVDYAMYIKPSGGVRDHGYLFRTSRDNFNQIFPLEKVYDLSNR